MEIAIQEVAESKTAVVVVEPIDLSRFIDCYDRVYAFLKAHRDVKQLGQNIALYDHGARMEVGVEVDRAFEPDGPVVPSLLPGGRVARATHTTGFADLAGTHDAIAAWCDENGHRRAGVQWEIYSDPDSDGQVDVDVCLLLR